MKHVSYFKTQVSECVLETSCTAYYVADLKHLWINIKHTLQLGLHQLLGWSVLPLQNTTLVFLT